MGAKVREQVELSAWREQLSQSFFDLDVEPLGASANLFPTISGQTKGRVYAATVDVQGEPHLIRRTRSSTRNESLLVSVQLRGSCIVRQHDKEAVLKPGDMALYDASQPYQLVFPAGDHKQAVLQVPAHELATLDSLRAHTAVRIAGDSGIAPAVSAMLTAIPKSIRDSEVVNAERLARSAMDLLALSFPTTGKIDRGATLVTQAHAFIEANADDPTLTPSAVAAALHLSLAHLHRLFRATDSTVSGLIKRTRLDRAATDLRDAKLAHWTVSEIALRRGFHDAAHFSRTFASHFGVAPGEWRRGA